MAGDLEGLSRTQFAIGAGPGALYPEVQAALARPLWLDSDPQFHAAYEAINEKATAALGSANPALILQSEAILGIEAAAASLIGKTDVVLNLASGPYGKGFGYWAARYCGELLEIETPYDEAIDPAAVQEFFEQRPDIKVVSVVHHETPLGIINPVGEIGRIVRDHDAFLIVDAVSSFAGMEIHPEDAKADIFIAGPGKCLGGSAGLTVMSVSERAWAHIDANPAAPFASILSLKDWRHAHLAEKPFPFHPLISEVFGLEAALDRYQSEGPEKVWARHARTALACRRGAEAMGLKLWPKDEAIASPTLTALRLPEGLDAVSLVGEMRRRYGVTLSCGDGDLAGKIMRIGHMGPTAEPMYSVIALTALGAALRSQGHAVDLAAGLEAALAVADAVGPD